MFAKGFSLKPKHNEIIIQDKHAYLKKFKMLLLGSSFKTFRSIWVKLAWQANTRPECLFKTALLALVTEKMFIENPHQIFKGVNNAIAFAVNNRISLCI